MDSFSVSPFCAESHKRVPPKLQFTTALGKINMELLLNFLPTLLALVIGSLIGFIASYLHWRREMSVKKSVFIYDQTRALIEQSYELIEYLRDYYVNSQFMEITQFQSIMSGRNPLKSILATSITCAPVLHEEVGELVKIIDNYMGPEYPVPKQKHLEATAAVNAFAKKAIAKYTYS